MIRCSWVKHKEDETYHDNEWGKLSLDERHLFEMLILEGMQAGLSWITILKKRDNFKRAFDNFDVKKVAAYDEEKIMELLANEGIIRNRLKVRAAVTNAQSFIKVQDEFGSFYNFLASFMDELPLVGHWEKLEDVPVSTEISDEISKVLKKRGFKFVGSVIIYSYMQAVGLVNDHTTDCFRYKEIVEKA